MLTAQTVKNNPNQQNVFQFCIFLWKRRISFCSHSD